MECNQIYLFITRFVTISNHTSFSKFSFNEIDSDLRIEKDIYIVNLLLMTCFHQGHTCYYIGVDIVNMSLS